MPHIFDVLHQDHQKVDQLLQEIKKSSDKESELRMELVSQVRQELTLHTRFEEQEVYPAIEGALGDTKLEHARDEHAEAMELLETLDTSLAEQEDGWKDHLEALTQSIHHHVHEEEDEIFPKARKQLSEAKAEEMAHQYRATKEKIAAE